MTELTLRIVAASLTLLAYGALCGAILLRQRRRRRADAQAAAQLAGPGTEHDTPATLVLFASQTGQAEALAWQTGHWLNAGGAPVRVMPLNELDAATLQSAAQALFIVATYGEADAPDNASVFQETLMAQPLPLPALRYAVMALGDAQYRHFCGFGRALDGWLQSSGASARFARIDVDNSDPVALTRWQTQWGMANQHADSADSVDPADAPFTPWRLVRRERLNPGSAGGPLFQLALRPQDDVAAQWQSGDLAQITLASDPSRPRDYSIASIQADGELQLLVRQERHPDGTLGAASGLLTSTLAHGDSVALRIRPHRNFQLHGNADRPLILIGNGTGLAGLRSHLRARQAAGQRDNWLLLGERNAAHDTLCRDEIDAWVRNGSLQRLDRVFSRDQADRVYVQHRLLQASAELSAWIARGAAVYVCGSLHGMADGVDAALRQVLGAPMLQELALSGRYRRDVY